MNNENLDIGIFQQIIGKHSNIIAHIQSHYDVKYNGKLITILNVSYTGALKNM